MPHNYRAALYATGEAPSTFGNDPDDEPAAPRPSPFGSDFVTLPIKMPTLLFTLTGDNGRVIAAWIDDRRVRWKDIDNVCEAVRQYNVHLQQMGITAPPAPPLDDADPDAGC
jgi:hypothetical protein